ncbi:N-acetylmuramoyl-L-alanine amidase [Luteimonas panaciterrae]|uniref:N-acetylmuramoyl-L-alanine amidase n=1 Tax=Luteimonas panaciterrae TaxID=363885 RepID=UPI001CF9E269|nr:N-acetylmuramoyl-L-alanine amidase [Luteimonas panaciterrae]
MRVKGATFQQFLLGLALLAALAWNLARASEINHLRVNAGATGTRAEVVLDKQAEFQVLTLANPDRLVVDLPGTSLGRGVKLPGPAGLVKSVRSGHPVPGTTRIVFDLNASVVALKPRFENGPDGSRLVLEWPGDEGAGPASATASTASAPTPAPANPAQTVAQTPASPGPAPSEADQSAASAAATSRLIASAVQPSGSQPSAQTQNPASPPQPQPTSEPSLQRTMPSTSSPSSGTPFNGATASVPTRIATGVPTRIATGVPTPVTPAPAQSSPEEDAPRPPTRAWTRGMRPLVVAIDPGHGGQDPGAIGMNGKREKDVTLAIGRELARQINATPGLKAYMTRDRDVFIPLPRRAQLARAAKADIFVSIHADAAENRSANGSSVYVLSLKGASSQRARWLADKENAADLIGGRMPAADNTLASVLLDLTQSGHMKASEDAANHVLSGLSRVGSNHKARIERANFAVLRTSDMPAMLVETAFISNPEEERLLSDPSYQRTLARAVLGGIDAYFQQQPPPGTMYAARADAGGASSGIGGAGGGGSP